MSKILEAVKADLDKREAKGLRSYGTTMDREDLTETQWLQHFYEEMLDGALYVKKIILNRNEVAQKSERDEPGGTAPVCEGNDEKVGG